MASKLKSSFENDGIVKIAPSAIEMAQAEMYRKLQLEMMASDDEEFAYHQRMQASRRSVGSNMLNLKGFGHRTIGAKQHGKVAIPCKGSGYGDYSRERLHRLA